MWKNYPQSGSTPARALSYLLAAHIQAIALILAAGWGATELDKHFPLDFSWNLVTFPVALLAIVHIFYVIIRMAFRQQRSSAEGSQHKGSKDVSKP